MIFKKPSSMRYTEMCIYIDQNIPKLVNPGEYPEIENTVYNYLWLLVKALAIKKCMFKNFEDYDMYSFYAATRLYNALRKNQLNQGKVIKGKLIRPIKSCLNYTKALLYPMKIEYQRENFREIIEEEFVSTKFDAIAYQECLKDEARDNAEVLRTFRTYIYDTVKQSDKLLDNILQKTPFNKKSSEYKNLKMSIILTSIYVLKNKKKLNAAGAQSVILWHLPKSMSNYTKILLKEFFTAIKQEVIDCYKTADLSEETLASILAETTKEWYENENQY